MKRYLFQTGIIALFVGAGIWLSLPLLAQTYTPQQTPAPQTSQQQAPAQPSTLLQQCLHQSHLSSQCPTTDVDCDGIINEHDNCPCVYNPDQTDTDNDGVGDACDNCPFVYNPDQTPDNSNPPDGFGAACAPKGTTNDPDHDGDNDSCSNSSTISPNQADTDGDANCAASASASVSTPVATTAAASTTPVSAFGPSPTSCALITGTEGGHVMDVFLTLCLGLLPIAFFRRLA